MEVDYGFTRADWVEIDARCYRTWFYGQRPLTGTEYAICWFFFLLSSVGALGLVGFLGAAVFVGLAWYFVVGALVLLVFDCGMFLEVVRPRREPVRGLFHELIFRMGLQEQALAKKKSSRAEHFRRLDEKGELVLSHRYHLSLEPKGLTLTTEYPSTAGTATRQEDRTGWDAVRSINRDDVFLAFTLADGRCIYLPCAAFAGEDACERFRLAAEAYRTTPAVSHTRIQTPAEICTGVHAV
jgi:hypothetical protein